MKNTRITLSILIVLVLSSFRLQQPPCQQVEIIQNETQKSLMYDLLIEWQEKNYFQRGRGIIGLVQQTTAEGKRVWGVYPMIDDMYKANPPDKYARFSRTVILIYDADSNGRDLPIKGEAAERIRCLEEVIGDLVYINPPLKPRYEEVRLPNGKKELREYKVAQTGGGGGYWITFNKDGTYVKTPMA